MTKEEKSEFAHKDDSDKKNGRPMGRDTARTMDAWSSIKNTTQIAPDLKRGVMTRSPELWKYRLSRVRNQHIGCCVGQSGAAQAETAMRTPDPLTPDSEPLTASAISPLWVYQIARKRSQELGYEFGNNEGAIISHGLQAVQMYGVIDMVSWPDTKVNEEAYSDDITPEAATNAKRLMPIGQIALLLSFSQVLEYMSAGYSVWMGTSWLSGAMETKQDGYFPWRGYEVGGHAVEALGYDLEKNKIWLGNSWAGWGLKGIQTGWTDMDSFAKSFAPQRMNSGYSEAVVVADYNGFVSKTKSWTEGF